MQYGAILFGNWYDVLPPMKVRGSTLKAPRHPEPRFRRPRSPKENEDREATECDEPRTEFKDAVSSSIVEA